VPPGRLPAGVADPSEVVDLLGVRLPGVCTVSVTKRRWQYDWTGGASAREDAVTVEVAWITAPEEILSVALEHLDLDRVREAHDALRVEHGMRRLSYLDAVAIWGRGEKVGALPGRAAGLR